MTWHWHRLSDEEKSEARRMVECSDWKGLLKLQNKHKLCGYILCCNYQLVKDWFIYAYENKMI